MLWSSPPEGPRLVGLEHPVMAPLMLLMCATYSTAGIHRRQDGGVPGKGGGLPEKSGLSLKVGGHRVVGSKGFRGDGRTCGRGERRTRLGFRPQRAGEAAVGGTCDGVGGSSDGMNELGQTLCSLQSSWSVSGQ